MKSPSIPGFVGAVLDELRRSGESLADSQTKLQQTGAAAHQAESSSLWWDLNLHPFSHRSPSPDAIRLLPATAALHYGVAPLAIVGNLFFVAVHDPTDADLMADLSLVTDRAIVPVPHSRAQIDQWIEECYPQGASSRGGSTFSAQAKTGHPDVQSVSNDDAPIIRLVDEIVTEAIHLGASDIHFEPHEKEMKVRFRLDGVLRVQRTVLARIQAEVVSRLKIMASLDIAEKRRPQDGRIRMQGGRAAVDLRVSTLPTEYGEKVVLRILDRGAVELDLRKLGMDEERLGVLTEAVKRPYGMVLVTGPTGSGKTTSLYSVLKMLRSPEVNITTVEDPIEYKLEGITQTAVKPEIQLTFANALRTILRQDPNIILVGEIRDQETAQIAVRAALTGHLVLSSLHTNDAPSAFTRLLDMGIEPFLVSSAVNLVVAQRLVRRVCESCDEVIGGGEGRRGKGCARCGRTGYSGRIGLYEMLPVTESIRELVTSRCDAGTIREKAVAEGMIGLRQDGLAKVQAGITTMEEIDRETA